MLVKDNKYIPSEDKDFFILLRIGLWQCVTEELSPNLNWEYIYKLSCEQTVQGIIADGIGIYRKKYPTLKITQEQNDKFLSASAQVVRRNLSINELLAKLCHLFNENEVNYVVMKGQTVAQYYPKPSLRCPGDIDFYFDDNNYDSARALLRPIADILVPEKYLVRKPVGFMFGSREVELHVDDGHYLGRHEIFKNLMNTMFCERMYRSYLCERTKVSLAPIGIEATYVFLHAYNHYCSSGVGLRQLTDLAMLIDKNKEELNKTNFKNYIADLKIIEGWNYFITFLSQFIGLENTDNIIIGEKLPHKNLLKIWKNVKRTGNFGHKEQMDMPRGNIHRILYKIVRVHKRFIQNYDEDPLRAIRQLCGLYKGFLSAFLKRLRRV